MNILFFGDIVGNIGIEALASEIAKLKKEFSADFVIANGENASRGKGLTEKDCYRILDLGVDVITLGNHYRSKSQIDDYIDDVEDIVRPLNLIDYTKGVGSCVFTANGIDIRVTNLLCQGLMNEEVKSPVNEFEKLLEDNEPCIHLVDLHGESSSEKKTFAFVFDGRVSAIVGTHTHVQTNDDQILPKGTGYITDLGMCGSPLSVIGFSKESVISKFVKKEETHIVVNEDDDYLINGVYLNIDEETFECLDIEKIRVVNRRN